MIGLIISVASDIDHDDWGISQNMFEYIDALLGPYETDFLQEIKMQSYQSFILDFGCPVL